MLRTRQTQRMEMCAEKQEQVHIEKSEQGARRGRGRARSLPAPLFAHRAWASNASASLRAWSAGSTPR